MVEIIGLNPVTLPSGIKAWVKNISGKFFHSNPEVFEGRVVGIGETQCEPAPVPDVTDPDTIQAAGESSPRLTAILIEDTDEAQLPDLLPIPGPFGFCQITALGLQVEIRNQGAGSSGSMTTTVDFFIYGTQSQSTPALAPGASAILNFPIPLGCFDSDCDFRILVDSAGVEAESNEINNIVSDLCLE